MYRSPSRWLEQYLVPDVILSERNQSTPLEKDVCKIRARSIENVGLVLRGAYAMWRCDRVHARCPLSIEAAGNTTSPKELAAADLSFIAPTVTQQRRSAVLSE